MVLSGENGSGGGNSGTWEHVRRWPWRGGRCPENNRERGHEAREPLQQYERRTGSQSCGTACS